MKNYRVFIGIALGVFILDYVAKFLTHHYIPRMDHESLWYPYGGIGVFRNFFGIEFSISHAINFGAAWGLGSSYQQELLILRVGLVIALLIYMLAFNSNRFATIPLILIITGAVANIGDYFIYGHVVDMFHFVLWGYDYPVFNVADISIFLGISALLLLSWFPAFSSAKMAGAGRKR